MKPEIQQRLEYAFRQLQKPIEEARAFLDDFLIKLDNAQSQHDLSTILLEMRRPIRNLLDRNTIEPAFGSHVLNTIQDIVIEIIQLRLLELPKNENVA